jgi:hypothetical protein
MDFDLSIADLPFQINGLKKLLFNGAKRDIQCYIYINTENIGTELHIATIVLFDYIALDKLHTYRLCVFPNLTYKAIDDCPPSNVMRLMMEWLNSISLSRKRQMQRIEVIKAELLETVWHPDNIMGNMWLLD